MADTVSDKQHRKSVAFSDGTTEIHHDGKVTEVNGTSDKTSAESHTASPPEAAANNDQAVDEVTDMFKGLAKKKKTKKPKDEDAKDGGTETPPAADGEFDPTAKKKKKRKPKAAETDDFEQKLAEAGVNENGEADGTATEQAPADDGDLELGTGIWQHSATHPISYPLLLSRFFTLLHSSHPDLMSGGTKSYKIPPPQCLREGNKKTIFANIADICKRMKRTDEHVTQFLFAELGTSGSVDGSRRLVIKGRFQQKQIENVLRRYIVEYVACKTCRSHDTELNKGENRLYFVTCNSCGSRRSVTAIKTGFSAQVGKRKRMQT